MRGAAAPLRDRSDRAVLLNPRGSVRAIVKRRNQAALCGSVSRAGFRQNLLSVQVGSSAKSARLGDSVKLRFLREAVQIGRYAKAARSRRGRANRTFREITRSQRGRADCILYGIVRSGIMRDCTRIPKIRARGALRKIVRSGTPPKSCSCAALRKLRGRVPCETAP